MDDTKKTAQIAALISKMEDTASLTGHDYKFMRDELPAIVNAMREANPEGSIRDIINMDRLQRARDAAVAFGITIELPKSEGRSK